MARSPGAGRAYAEVRERALLDSIERDVDADGLRRTSIGWAALWGTIAGTALFMGAAIGWFRRPSEHHVVMFTAFGGGILLAIAAFELLAEAVATAAILAIAAGYMAGALAFTVGLTTLDRAGARHRKRIRFAPVEATVHTGAPIPAHRAAPTVVPSAAAPSPVVTPPPVGVIALATALDSIPESFIIGTGFAAGDRLGVATAAAIVLANIPEALSSTMRMKSEGRRAGAVFAIWGLTALVTGVCAAIGYAISTHISHDVLGFVRGIAGGALFVLVADYVLPEALHEMHERAGLVAASGFLAGLLLIEGIGQVHP